MSLDVILDRRLLIISGKGGVGKTTVAAALGVLAQRSGRRVLVCEVEGKNALGAPFGIDKLDDTPRPLSGDLYGMNISAERALEEYFETQFHMKRIARPLVTSQLVYYVTHAAPGLRDILMLGKVWYEATRRKSFDLIILDTAAAGHAVSMLRSPEGFLTAVPMGPLANHARQVAQWLKDPNEVALHLVTLAEEMPANETTETVSMLEDRLAIDVAGVFVNMLYPPPAEDPDTVKALEQLDSSKDLQAEAQRAGTKLEKKSADGLFEAVSFYLARRASQKIYRDHLDDVLSGTSKLVDLPYLFCEEFGVDQLGDLADVIEQTLS